jgi:hypothetical protein
MKENYKEQKESNRGDEAATYREDMLSRNDIKKCTIDGYLTEIFRIMDNSGKALKSLINLIL